MLALCAAAARISARCDRDEYNVVLAFVRRKIMAVFDVRCDDGVSRN